MGMEKCRPLGHGEASKYPKTLQIVTCECFPSFYYIKMKSIIALLMKLSEGEFQDMFDKYVDEARDLVNRDRTMREPVFFLNVAAAQVRGFEKHINGYKTERPHPSTEDDLRELTVAAKRFAKFKQKQVDLPIVLHIPMTGDAKVSVPYTNKTITVRVKHGGLPEGPELKRDMLKFLRDYEGLEGAAIRQAMEFRGGKVEAEVDRAVAVYTGRRSDYMAWTNLSMGCYDLFRARVEATEIDEWWDSGEDSAPESSDVGEDDGEVEGGNLLERVDKAYPRREDGGVGVSTHPRRPEDGKNSPRGLFHKISFSKT